MKVLTLYVAMLVGFIVMMMLVIAMAGCAAAGLYNMSDEWCAHHQKASANRCPGEDR